MNMDDKKSEVYLNDLNRKERPDEQQVEMYKKENIGNIVDTLEIQN